jgi:VanZ family protein
VKRALAPLAWMGLIFYLSAQPAAGPDVEWLRVLAHFTQFAVLAALWTWALGPRLGGGAILAAGMIAVAYAIADEYHQGFVEGRDSAAMDALVDSAGVAFACTFAALRRQARGSASTLPTHSTSRG